MDGLEVKLQTDSQIKRIIEELSKIIEELKKENNFRFDPAIMKLERVLRFWKSDQE